jgi:hypothetical protein
MELSEPHVTNRKLNTLHRDVRVTAGEIRIVLNGGVAAFAQAIVQRYEAWQKNWPSLALILRQAKRGFTIYCQNYLTEARLSPRISFEIVQRLFTRMERINGLTRIHGSVATAAGASLREAETTKRAPLSSFSPEVRPVPRVFRRPIAISGTGEVAPSPSFIHDVPPQIAAHARDNRPRVVNVPSIEVSRLTDQVIQAIDRRIIAQRERLGRV